MYDPWDNYLPGFKPSNALAKSVLSNTAAKHLKTPSLDQAFQARPPDVGFPVAGPVALSRDGSRESAQDRSRTCPTPWKKPANFERLEAPTCSYNAVSATKFLEHSWVSSRTAGASEFPDATVGTAGESAADMFKRCYASVARR